MLLTLASTAVYLGEARGRIDGNRTAAMALAPALFALSMGLAPALSMAFVGGVGGRRGPGGFVRTAKTGDPAVPFRPDMPVIFGLTVAALALTAAILFVVHLDVIGAMASIFVAGSCTWVAIGTR
jgi:hypothetical protein